MCLLVPPFLSTTNSLCQGTHESYNEWKLEITETDGRHLSLLYPPAYTGGKNRCTHTLSDLICHSSALHRADRVSSRTEKLPARRWDTAVLFGFSNRHNARWNLLGKTEWVTTHNKRGLQLSLGSSPYRQVITITIHPSCKIRPYYSCHATQMLAWNQNWTCDTDVPGYSSGRTVSPALVFRYICSRWT